MKNNLIHNLLETKPQYRNALFSKGYLVTSDEITELDSFPFYGNWQKYTIGKLKNSKIINLIIHDNQDSHIVYHEGIHAAIIGHAYNPFNMMYQENEILNELIVSYKENTQAFFEKVNELTGIHLIILNDNGTLLFLQDCGGMKSCYYGIIDNNLSITSHPQLLGDLYNLQVDPKLDSLIQKWFFSIGGRYLPGDLSPYKNIKRLGPNTFVRFNTELELERFYPIKNHPEIEPEQYEHTIEKISKLIHNNIKLCTYKWKSPAVSLSGGMDSKTTLSCANGLYDKFKYYSFHCKPQEIVDANAAHEICKSIGVKHKIYAIPDKNEAIEDYDVLKKIIFHNASYIGKPHDHEIRKFIYLSKLNDFDVELKSWISEVGRAMWGKKYGREMPQVLTPRHFSIFQTRYLLSPNLLRHSDFHYKDYLQRIDLIKPIFNFEHADSFYWEFRFGSWGGSVNTIHDIFYHAITMPMNNRKIIEMFLWFPHEFRKNDGVNKAIIKYANNKILDLNLNVHNTYLGGKRVFIEKMYYTYRTNKLFKWISI